MRAIKITSTLVACLVVLSLLTACGHSGGIRKLIDVETNYFKGLDTHLKKSVDRMNKVLEKRTAENEEMALKQIALLDDNIRRAKLVYSIREVLTAPEGDNATFIQVTRNKIILYYLAEMGQAQNEKLLTELARGKEERKMLINGLKNLNTLTSEAIASNQVLHNHLNKSGTAQLADIIAEVGRQVTAFNEGIKEADQENPAIKRIVAAGKDADIRIQQAADGLSRFNDIWPKLNKELKE
jgi:hypothetical protein